MVSSQRTDHEFQIVPSWGIKVRERLAAGAALPSACARCHAAVPTRDAGAGGGSEGASWEQEASCSSGLSGPKTLGLSPFPQEQAQSWPRLVLVLRGTSAKQERAGESCCTKQGWKQAGKKDRPTDITTRKLKSPKTGLTLLHTFSSISVMFVCKGLVQFHLSSRQYFK